MLPFTVQMGDITQGDSVEEFYGVMGMATLHLIHLKFKVMCIEDKSQARLKQLLRMFLATTFTRSTFLEGLSISVGCITASTSSPAPDCQGLQALVRNPLHQVTLALPSPVIFLVAL